VPMCELKVTYGSWCVEGAKKYNGFGARALKMRLWVKTCVHYLLHSREENFG
jgi:hypothetical protein